LALGSNLVTISLIAVSSNGDSLIFLYIDRKKTKSKNNFMNKISAPQTVSAWLKFIAKDHPKEIDLGLTRISVVAKKLKATKFVIPVITISGTNGKGSTAATLESIYLAAGFRVGVFSSPFIWRYNEQIRINGVPVSEEILCKQFAIINKARKNISLSNFEFLTLATLKIFQKSKPDVVVLEVRMGGKRDAVNIVDPSLAIITNITIEHIKWLGNTREKIAAEKAGIMRKKIPVIYGDNNPPKTIINYAKKTQAKLYLKNRDFSVSEQKNYFTWQFLQKTKKYVIKNIPTPSLLPINIATALTAITLLQNKLPVNENAIRSGISKAKLPGRFQVIPGKITQILDVAHNPASAKILAKNLTAKITSKEKTVYAIFSMLEDKDIARTIAPLKNIITKWYIAPLKTERAASLTQIRKAFQKVKIKECAVIEFPTIKNAYQTALRSAKTNDIVLAYGSFRVIGCV
jgi:dihydrofolate synthase / folylpolyglutamate synthase